MWNADTSSVVTDTDRTNVEACEVGTLTPEELEDEIAELCAHIDAATYRLLRAIGELDCREAWASGYLSTTHWLSWKVGIDLATEFQLKRADVLPAMHLM